MRKSVLATAAVVLMAIAPQAYGQQAGVGVSSKCIEIPAANLPALCQTQTGYSGYFPGNSGNKNFNRSADFDRLIDEISATISEIERYKGIIQSNQADTTLPKEILDKASQGQISAQNDYVSGIRSVSAYDGDYYNSSIQYYQSVSRILSDYRGVLSNIVQEADQFRAQKGEERQIEARRVAAAAAAEAAEQRRTEEFEAFQSQENWRQVSSSLVLLLVAAIYLWVAKKYANRSSIKDEHGDEFSTFGGNFNDQQMEIYNSVRETAESRDFWKSALIGIALAGLGFKLTNEAIVSSASNLVSILLIPGLGVWIYGTFLIVKAHASKSEGRVRKFIEERSKDLQCPKCDAHFAAMTERLSEKLIAAIPRQSRSVGKRDSNGQRSVFESYWTEARYEVRMRDHCACCDYDKRYLVQEAREENKRTTRYSE